MAGKRLEHQGIKVQLIGQIELASERTAVRSHTHDFVSLGARTPPDCFLWGSCERAFVVIGIANYLYTQPPDLF